MRNQAHRPGSDLTRAEVIRGLAFGALALCLFVGCYLMLVLWLAWATAAPVAP